MPRKSVIRYAYVGLKAEEVLPHNPKRLSATIVADGQNQNGTYKIGNTAHQAESSPTIFGYYYLLEVHGINSIWACNDTNNTGPQGLTIIEIVEE